MPCLRSQVRKSSNEAKFNLVNVKIEEKHSPKSPQMEASRKPEASAFPFPPVPSLSKSERKIVTISSNDSSDVSSYSDLSSLSLRSSEGFPTLPPQSPSKMECTSIFSQVGSVLKKL